jgi:hypothetical protein
MITCASDELCIALHAVPDAIMAKMIWRIFDMVIRE